MVPFAPLEDAEEPEPCHKMELYVSGGEVSAGLGRVELPGPRPATRGHLPPRAPPPLGAAGPGAEGRRTATPPAPASPPRPSPLPGCAGLPPPRLPAPCLSVALPRWIPALSAAPPPPLPRLPRDPPQPARLPGAAARLLAPPPGHLACSRLVPPSSRTGTGLPGSSPQLRLVPGRRRPPGATRSPSPPPREGPSTSPRASLGGCGRRHRVTSRRRLRGSEGGGGPRSPPGCGLRDGSNTCAAGGERTPLAGIMRASQALVRALKAGARRVPH